LDDVPGEVREAVQVVELEEALEEGEP